MSRVTTVTKTRKEFRDEFTGQTIPVGSTVYKWTTGWGGREKVSTRRPKESEMTNSEGLATVLAALEAVEEGTPGDEFGPDEMDDFASLLDEQADEARSGGELLGEAADNIESGFPNGNYLADEMRARADAAETMADEMTNAAEAVRSAASEWEAFLTTHADVLGDAKTPDDLPEDFDTDLAAELTELYEAAVTAIEDASNITYDG
jgi:hypothetical protein